ncbi:hypothetical protein ACHAQJ_005578 [Trichoderma viride]
MAQRLSDTEEKPLILNYDLLHLILTEYMDKDQDILNFILANKLHHRLFYDTLLRHNVHHGGCTALEWAARRGNLDFFRDILAIPGAEASAPQDIWLKILDIVQNLEHIDLAKLLFQVKSVQTCIKNEAREVAINGVEYWEDCDFIESWLARMWFAVDLGHEVLVELYLSHGMTVDLPDSGGHTAVYIAARNREKEHLVRLLLEKYEADPNGNYSNRADDTLISYRPLDMAAGNGSLEVIKLLLSHGADPCSGQTGTFSSALLMAISAGYKDVVKLLLQDERIDPNEQNGRGDTILGAAVAFGNTDMVKVLLEHEHIDPNGQNGRGDTILGTAVMTGNTDMVKMLLEHDGIDPNGRDFTSRSPLLIAACGFIIGPEEPSALVMAKLLLSDERVDASLKDFVGWGALSLAAQHSQHEILKMLLDNGKLDPNEVDNAFRTPVFHAACNDEADSLKLLIEDKRVDLNRANTMGLTPLMMAVSRSASWDWATPTRHVDLLLNSGRVDVNLADARGYTAMMLSCTLQIPKITRLLLDVDGVDLVKKNKRGQTALMMAVKLARYDLMLGSQPALDVIKMILDTGHDLVNFRDDDGVAMIEYAVRTGIKEVVELLLGTGKVVVTSKAMELAQQDGEILCMLAKYNQGR